MTTRAPLLASLSANIRGAAIVTPWILHLFATDLVLSTLLPFSFFFPTAAYNVSSRLAAAVWYGVQLIFTRLNRACITTSGDVLPHHESAIVIANHVSWTDFYMIQQLAIRSGMLGRCRWFAKQQLKWVPFLGWGLWAMGMPLVSRRWDRDQRELDRVFRGPKQFNWPICMLPLHIPWLACRQDSLLTYDTGLISYSEATRYTPQKYTETVQWCKANDRPIPKYTLYPRTKGFVTTVKALRQSGSVKAVYDLTIAYAHGNQFLEAPSMWASLSVSDLCKDRRFHVHAERYELSELGTLSDSELAQWLEDRWMEKSRRLEELQMELERGVDWSQHDLDSNKKLR